MEEIAVVAEPRAILGKRVKQIRRQDLIPATLYGREVEARPLQIPRRSLEAVLSKAGINRLIKLTVEGENTSSNVLVREVQRDVLNGSLLHVDLYSVLMSETITTEIPVVLVNESPAALSAEALLVQDLQTIEVECLPGDLIGSVEVDLSHLVDVHDSIQVSDIDLGDSIRVLNDPDDVLVRVLPVTREEVEEVEEIPEVLGEVEVLTEAERVHGREDLEEGEETEE
jgi:large subunit ribosomal protein L25